LIDIEKKKDKKIFDANNCPRSIIPLSDVSEEFKHLIIVKEETQLIMINLKTNSKIIIDKLEGSSGFQSSVSVVRNINEDSFVFFSTDKKIIKRYTIKKEFLK
jgi:hypothetical protein